MQFDVDGGKLLYVLGVVFALGALTYFARDVVFGLSITVTAALLFVIFLCFLVAGFTIDRDVLDVVAFAVAGLAYVVFLWYVTMRYGLTDTGIFLLLSASAVLFVGLGYGVRTVGIDLPVRRAGAIVLALVLLSTLLAAADVVSGDVTTEIELEDTVTVSVSDADADRDDHVRVSQQVGTVTVSNPSPFTRPVDLPRAHGCVVGWDDHPDDRLPVQFEPSQYETADHLERGDSRTYDLEVSLALPANETDEQTLAVERGEDCDVSRSEPTLVVVLEDDDIVAV
ncbi:hypothetical protein [Natrarchaeobaculum aegyptiacum]|uniref:DUF1109 domain-containing protein n=1 Tax=Natrarchaeobaculum aegyptiacum TaxID=745377 RepID=A0A2Z2HRU0_9EURY|nr:hypothetical protein [Natrarchaeobaculum aegyptiacum]ARS89503.1 hypothetical protein B1756_06915 [Natrarchaeobaculum aegyptiacum]